MFLKILTFFRFNKITSKKKVLLYPGSFNPIHYGHLTVAKKAWESGNFYKLFFLLTPQNPFKHSDTLLPYRLRYRLLKVALRSSKVFRSVARKWIASSYEQKIIQKKILRQKNRQQTNVLSSTVQTIRWLKKKQPHFVYTLVLGEDNLADLHKWHHYRWLLNDNNVTLLVFERKNVKPYDKKYRRYLTSLPPDSKWEKKIDWQSINSTHIRKQMIKQKIEKINFTAPSNQLPDKVHKILTSYYLKNKSNSSRDEILKQ